MDYQVKRSNTFRQTRRPGPAGNTVQREDIKVLIGTPKETANGEARVALTPDSARQLQKLGYACAIETGAGAAAGFSDAAYAEAGVEIVKT
ncbi:hypothetical protein KUV61_18250, partial [Nocardioides marinus]|nr:hypothetical protein [Nocardioides marinus]